MELKDQECREEAANTYVTSGRYLGEESYYLVYMFNYSRYLQRHKIQVTERHYYSIYEE